MSHHSTSGHDDQRLQIASINLSNAIVSIQTLSITTERVNIFWKQSEEGPPPTSVNVQAIDGNSKSPTGHQNIFLSFE